MKEIMIVDDEASTIRLVEIMFEKEPGYRVTSAKSGRECIEKLQGGYRPDIILLDIKMSGMDGYQVAAHIKSDIETQGLRIFFFSALPKETVLIKEGDERADGFIEKYAEMDRIADRIKKELGE